MTTVTVGAQPATPTAAAAPAQPAQQNGGGLVVDVSFNNNPAAAPAQEPAAAQVQPQAQAEPQPAQPTQTLQQ